MMQLLKTTVLFVIPAVAEIVGCYLPWLVVKQGRPGWLLLPAAVSLALFAWLLTLHPFAAGRTYAAYGGVYIAVALAWLWMEDGVTPDALGCGRRGGGAARHGDHRDAA
jgi:small multidrug resistance family-3 protein